MSSKQTADDIYKNDISVDAVDTRRPLAYACDPHCRHRIIAPPRSQSGPKSVTAVTALVRGAVACEPPLPPCRRAHRRTDRVAQLSPRPLWTAVPLWEGVRQRCDGDHNGTALSRQRVCVWCVTRGRRRSLPLPPSHRCRAGARRRCRPHTTISRGGFGDECKFIYS